MPAPGIRSLISAIAWSTALCSNAVAAEEPSAGVEVEGETVLITPASLSSSGGRSSQTYGQLDLSFPLAGAENWGLGADLIGTSYQYRFRNFGDFLPGTGTPLTAAADLSFEPTLLLMPSATSTWVLGGSIERSGASGAHLKDSLLLSGSAGWIWKKNKNLQIGVGLQVYQEFPHSRHLLPFPLIEWNYGPWTLTALDGETGQLSYALTHQTTVFARLEFQSREVRLSSGSTIASGILHYEAFPAVLGIRFKLKSHFTLSLSSGIVLGQQLEFCDKNRRLLRVSDRKYPARVGLGIDWAL